MSPESQVRSGWWPLVAVLLAIASAVLPIAATYAQRYQLPFSSAVGIYVCFLLLLAYAALPAASAGRQLLALALGQPHQAIKLLALLLLPYLCYAWGTGDLQWQAILRLLLAASPVVIVYSAIPVLNPTKFNLQDLFAATWLVGVVLSHFMVGVWTRPANLDFLARFWLFTLGALCWTYIRPVRDLGYELQITPKVLLASAKNFLFFAIVAIPLGVTLGFAGWNPRWHGVLDFAAAFLEIFLFIAMLEELFFRGFLQNLLEKSLQSRWRGQILASCIFGLFHILHAPFPNWRYVILASIAGWFYGSAYRESGSLLGSAFAHAAVDTAWRAFFTRE